jgi:hypothetical protein
LLSNIPNELDHTEVTEHCMRILFRKNFPAKHESHMYPASASEFEENKGEEGHNTSEV